MASRTSHSKRRTPRQARSRAACDAIVEAAAQILEQRGAGALTTNAVAERAGVSIGTLYQYFPDKQAILIAAARREFGSAPLGRRPAALAQALIAALERLAGFGGAAAAPSPRRAVASSRKSLERRVAEAAADWLGVFIAPPLPALRPIPIHRRRL